ncbi:DUF4159 domain-containing protein [Sneathiella chungangensis]|uniref:DUF4159 domain-containing protein n=1 Tax=Sneathiella chungangensis TaxID=1418234 RepID=A0A845MIH1_9PROT|nr:DUF4159 domain-containing protein [Sneathiella chungangensis]MZR23126.1 DUF4159 domain-containing protein [Sneathiella chungangensis]
MAALMSLSFLYPWVLTALLALPLIWWLLRIVPPQPKSVIFPAMRFLYGLKKDEQSSATTPWWLLLLRLVIAALIILAIARPVLNLPEQQNRSGEMVLIVDDGWTSAQSWDGLKATLTKLINDSTRQGRQIFVVTTSRRGGGAIPSLQPLADQEALGIAASLEPKSWPSDYSDLSLLLPRLETLDNPEFIWLSSGISRSADLSGLQDFLAALNDMGPVTIYRQETVVAAPIIETPKFDGDKLNIPLSLPTGATNTDSVLTARAGNGQILASAPVTFPEGEYSAIVALNVPNRIRNDIRRLEIANSNNAGAVFLLDQRWQRRQVGLVTSDSSQVDQPLLNETHYLRKALEPFFDITGGTIEELLEEKQSLIALGDTANLPEGVERTLGDWIAKGGVLIRFAGPKLANSTGALVPVELRSGNRSLQGAMSWNQPAPLGPIPRQSPFTGLSIPKDVTVTKQVLANPSPDLLDKTWAQLEDGTPLVTAAKSGAGWIVLFHTTASPDWSNLALSGLFVEMLREIGNLGQYVNQNLAEQQSLPPFQLLNGFGRLTTETGVVDPLNTADIGSLSLNERHPPGLYGNENFSIAINIGQFDAAYSVVDMTQFAATFRYFERSSLVDLLLPLLLTALLLVMIDQIISLHLQGRLPALGKVSRASIFIFAVSFGLSSIPGEAPAQEANLGGDAKILAATLDTRLGYILTQDRTVDQMSHDGLAGLSRQLRNRTAVEAEDPLPIDIEQDELIFYPFIYWPITPDFPPLSEQAILKLNDYFKGGGTVLFDTRNQNAAGLYGIDLYNSPENTRLRQLTSRLDIPRVQQVPPDHVLTRAFYLMQTFPGRYDGGDVWIEDTSGIQGNDGVASVVIGSNDWAAAWAIDSDGRYQAATLPGNERQRELAYRFGINLVMYTLTGNYKSDQVHIPAILERLGQ